MTLKAVSTMDPEKKRHEAAADVLNEFAATTETLSIECTPMSGYFVVVFDDEGRATFQSHFGANFPVPPVMLPDIIRQCMVQEVYAG